MSDWSDKQDDGANITVMARKQGSPAAAIIVRIPGY